MNIIANTITNNDNAVMHSLYSNNATINPIEKILKLRMLKEKEEMMDRPEKLIEKK